MVNIDALLCRPESKTLEFKRDLSSLVPLLKTLVAFANTAGGTLVVGVEDDGHACGVSTPAAQELQLGSAIADSIAPALLPELDVVEYRGKSLIVVQVPFWRGPYFYKAEGPEKGVYVRLGSSTRRAGPELLAEMQRTLARTAAFDELPCLTAGTDGLDVDSVHQAFRLTGRHIDEASLLSLGLLVPHAGHLYPSNGGIILFGKERQRLFPDARVSCARFLGTTKAEFIDRLDIEGSILDAVQDVPKFIRRNTRLGAKIEGWGSGYRRIQEVCQTEGYPEPEWEELGIATRVVFKPHPRVAAPQASERGRDDGTAVAVNGAVNDVVTEGLNHRQLWLLEQLIQGFKLRRPDFERHWTVSYRTAQRDIAELVRRGLIEFVGAPRNGVYQLKHRD